MGNCCGSSAAVPSSPPPPPPAQALQQQETAPSTHLTPMPLSSGPHLVSTVVSTSKGSSRRPAHHTAQHDDEMTSTPGAVTTTRVRSQDSAFSQGRRDGGGYPPSPSGGGVFSSQPPHRPEIPSRQDTSSGRSPPKLSKSPSMDTTSFLQGARSHSPGRMTRSSSAFLLGDGRPPAGTHSGSLPVPGTNQLPDERPGGRPRSRSRLSSNLQILLPNDFRYAVRHRLVGHYYYSIIVHRFRILVLGKVRAIYSDRPWT
jgi:hypothetical protein